MPSSVLSRQAATVAALAFAAFGMASTAHARSDVTFSIGIQVPGAYMHPAPVYVPPRQVYYQPQPVYQHPAPVYLPPRQVYYQPQPVYQHPAPVYLPPRQIYFQPRPVYVQPPNFILYDQRRGWHRGHGHHQPRDGRHGRHGHFDNRGGYQH